MENNQKKGASKMSRYQLYTRLIITGLILLLGACGGNGDDIDDHSHDAVTKTFSFYINDAGNLYAVDPTNPTAGSIEVKAGSSSLVVTDYHFIEHGTYNSTTDTISDIHYPYLVVVNTDSPGPGHSLFKINTLVSAGTPVASQLSNSSGIDICSMDHVTNFASSSSAYFMFKEVATGGACSSSSWKMVSISDTSTKTPDNIKKVISGTYDSTGSLTGFLLKDSNNDLATVDTTLTTYTKINDASSSPINMLNMNPRRPTPNKTGTIILSTDNTTGGKLYAYNMNSNAVTTANVLHTLDAFWVDNSKDENYLFFDDGTNIARINRDGSAVSTNIVTSVTTGITKLGITDNNLVFLNDAGSLYTVAKTSASVAESSTTLVSTNVTDFFTLGSNIFYNSLGVAHYVDEDGSTGAGSISGAYAGNATGAAWIGATESTTRSDELPKDKEHMILFTEASDTQNAFYKVDGVSLQQNNVAVLTLDASINISDALQFGSDDREGDYSILAILTGAPTGDAVYALNAHDGTTTRVDNSATTADDAKAVLSPK